VLQATARLKAAEEASSAAERDAAAKEALVGLLKVPQCVNLAQMVPRLAFLRQYEVSRLISNLSRKAVLIVQAACLASCH